LTGTVADASGAVVPDASVAVMSTATSAVRTAKTDRVGHYLVAASQQSLANLTLPVGQAAETVTVEASSMPSVVRSLTRKKTEGRPAINPSPPVFEITTDAGDRWTSTDGQTWKHK
jgi:hypothetical protein